MTLAATADPPPVPRPADVALRVVPPVPSEALARSRRSARVQGVLAIGSLVAAVVGTVALVLTPVRAPDGAPGSSSSRLLGGRAAGEAAAVALPAGLRVDVRGGEPLIAYGVADRLTGAGAALGAVLPAAADDTAPETTTIVYYDRASMAVADRIRSMLGRGTLRRQQVFQPVVDVTIVLGKDLSRL